MAEEDSKDRNLPPRDFVDALVEDPANPPQLQVLTGYRGRSAQEGNTRLYIDPELTGWVDIPEDAILYQRETQDEYGLTKSLVWTRLDAQIQMGPQDSGGTGADFLQGQVAQDLGGGAGAQASIPRTQLFCPTRPPFLCPTPPRLCPITRHHHVCPPTPGIHCVLQTANPQQCPSLGITCTALPPCPPRTVPPACPQTPGIACIPSVLIACPPLTQDPRQCGLQTANPLQCPSLGITCTALPPCPTRDVNQCGVPPQPSQNLAGCIPRPTSDPRLCPVATPNPGCIPIPGGPGGPGGPVEGAQQEAQGFGGIGPVGQADFSFHLRTPVIVCPTVWEPQCFRTVFEPQCLRTVFEPQCLRTVFEPHCFQVTPPLTIDPTTPQFGGGGFGDIGQGGGFAGGGGQGFEAQGMGAADFQHFPRTSPAICLSPVTAQAICHVQTIREPRCWVTRIRQICDPIPVSPWCPIGHPITGPGPATTPQFGTPHLGGFAQGAQGFEAQGGMGAEAVSQFCPQLQQTQFCPAPNTAQLTCPVTRNIQCFTSRMCPRSTFCPSVAIPCQTGPVCQPVTLGCPFGGGGGGFGGGF